MPSSQVLLAEVGPRPGLLEQAKALKPVADTFARAALERWPLPSLREELWEHKTRGEWAFMQAFAGHEAVTDD